MCGLISSFLINNTCFINYFQWDTAVDDDCEGEISDFIDMCEKSRREKSASRMLEVSSKVNKGFEVLTSNIE